MKIARKWVTVTDRRALILETRLPHKYFTRIWSAYRPSGDCGTIYQGNLCHRFTFRTLFHPHLTLPFIATARIFYGQQLCIYSCQSQDMVLVSALSHEAIINLTLFC